MERFKPLLLISLTLISGVTRSDTLKYIVSEGLRNSFGIQTQGFEFKQADIARKNTYTALLPTFTLSRSRTYSKNESLNTDDGSTSYANDQSDAMSISSSWTLFNNYENIRNVQIAERTFEAQKISNDLTINQYVISLVEAYTSFQLLLEREKIEQERLRQSQWVFNRAKQLVKIGSKTAIDTIDSEIDVLNSEKTLLEIRNEITNKKRELLFLINSPKVSNIPKVDLLKIRPYFIKQAESKIRMYGKKSTSDYIKFNPDLKKTKLELDNSKANLAQKKFDWFPKLSLSTSWTYDMSNEVKQDQLEQNQQSLNAFSLAINLSWTFWDWLQTPRNIRNEEYEFQKSRINFLSTRFKKNIEIKNLFLKYEILKKTIKIQRLVLTKAKKNMEYNTTMYRLGRTTLITYQRAQSKLADATFNMAEQYKEQMIQSLNILLNFGEDLRPRG